MSAPRTNNWQPQLRIRAEYSGPRLKMPQGFLASAHTRARFSIAVEALRVLEVTGHAQHLAQVGRADEQQVDVGDRGDVFERGQRTCGLDLNADEGLGIGPGRVFGQRSQAEPAVAIASVQARARPAARTWPTARPARRPPASGPC